MKYRKHWQGLLIFILFTSICHTQESGKMKIHKIWITMVDGSTVKGSLYNANSLGVKVADNKSMDMSKLITIKAEKIQMIKIQRKGRIGKSILIGGGIGIVFGGLIGFTDGDDAPGWFSYSKEEKAMAGSIVFGVLGTGVGALVGTKKEKFIINGNIQNYEQHLKNIQGFSLQQVQVENLINQKL